MVQNVLVHHFSNLPVRLPDDQESGIERVKHTGYLFWIVLFGDSPQEGPQLGPVQCIGREMRCVGGQAPGNIFITWSQSTLPAQQVTVPEPNVQGNIFRLVVEYGNLFLLFLRLERIGKTLTLT